MTSSYSLLLSLILLNGAYAFVSSNRGATPRVFGLQRAAISSSSLSTVVEKAAADVRPAITSDLDTVRRSASASTSADVNPDLLGNRASEWFMPRIGGLTPATLKSKDQEEDSGDEHKSLITTVESEKDFTDFLSANDDQLSVVFFHASWCKTCQRFGLRYKKIASLYADKIDQDGAVVEHGQIRMTKVEWGANTDLCRSLHVETLPSVHFYRAGEKIANYEVPPERFEDVQVAVEQYLEDGTVFAPPSNDNDDQDDNDDDQELVYLSSILDAGNNLMKSLLPKDNQATSSSKGI